MLRPLRALIQINLHTPKRYKQVVQGFQPLIAHSSHPTEVAHAILNALNSPSPELRYLVGKDAECIFKARTRLSDKELEQWVREVI